MHYFAIDGAVIAVQNDDKAQAFEAKGARRVTREAFRAAWKRRNERTMARIAAEDAPDTRHKIVGALPGVEYPKTETGL